MNRGGGKGGGKGEGEGRRAKGEGEGEEVGRGEERAVHLLPKADQNGQT